MDTRRFQGPDGCFPYQPLMLKPKHKERIKNDIYMKTDVLSQGQGSAYVEEGNSKVVCSIFGPREIPRRVDFSMKGLLLCQLNWAPFSKASDTKIAPKEGQMFRKGSDSVERETSLIIQQALQSTVCLHLYPKSQIDVYILILEDDGNALASAMTCASLALADASIHMFDLIIGIAKEISPKLDGENCEQKSSSLTVGYSPNLEQVAMMKFCGICDSKTLTQHVDDLCQKAKDLLPSVKSCLMSTLHEDG